MTQYQEYIHKSRYSRWRDDLDRRETWDETVDRVRQYWIGHYPWLQEDQEYLEAMDGFQNLDQVPSMRLVMTAGEAADRDNVAIYNCSFAIIDSFKVLDELMYILLCGTGDGFSVERQGVQQLPVIAEEFHPTDTVIHVADSKIGWAKSLRELISMLAVGQLPRWDVSKVRVAGERLKTFGGRASGPEPLEELFKYTVNTFRRFAGQQLPSIAVHDLMCKIADIVVVGGVRRSALISLSDIDDPYMAKAKSPYEVKEYTLLGYADETETKRRYSILLDDGPYGERSLILDLNDWESGELQANHTVNWWHVHPERALANNSVVYQEKPNIGTFMKEWVSLYESKSGERGIFSREAAQKHVEKNGRRDSGYEFGTNPCSEIILRSKQFCNLSEVVIRSTDTLDDLKRKVRYATVFGTLQATRTNFRYLSKKWRDNTEEEALLGVSLTGIMDHPVMSGQESIHDFWDEDTALGNDYHPVTLEQLLYDLKEVAVETNKEWAEKLGINPSTSITCVKPSGTVSQLVDSASGIHARHNPHYIRTVRADKKDPLTQMLTDQGVPAEDAIGKEDSTTVFSFPVKAPEDAIFRNDISAIEHLELWKTIALNWCEHKPSITVYIKEEEWFEAGAWVWENFDTVSGISFLPYDGGSYQQAPYQDCSEEEYYDLLAKMPEIDWEKLSDYETSDNVTVEHELACSGGACEIL